MQILNRAVSQFQQKYGILDDSEKDILEQILLIRAFMIKRQGDIPEILADEHSYLIGQMCCNILQFEEYEVEEEMVNLENFCDDLLDGELKAVCLHCKVEILPHCLFCTVGCMDKYGMIKSN